MNLEFVLLQFILVITANAQYHTSVDDGLYYPRMGKRAFITDILTDSSINQLKGEKAKILKFTYELSNNDVENDDYIIKKPFVSLMKSPPRKIQNNNHFKLFEDSSNEYDVQY